MKTFKLMVIFGAILIFGKWAVFAKGVGTSGGLTLTEPQGARAAALGEAFTAAENDSSAMAYNPATLSSLKSNHANLMYDKGLADDSYGQFTMGLKRESSNLGVNIGYYNGGSMAVCEGGDCNTNTHSVTAQSDLNVGLTMSNKLGPVGLGVSAKYLSSKLIDKYSANAFALDAGFMVPVGMVQVGGALLNLGSKMSYSAEGDSLPRIASLGMSLPMNNGLTVFANAPYLLNEKQMNLGLGLEFMVGPLALRTGYHMGSDLQNFSVGMGFVMGKMSMDYAFGLSKELDNVHRVSLGMRFGGEAAPVQLTRARPVQEQPKYSLSDVSQRSSMTSAEFFPQRKSRVYTVQPGDTLRTIAKRQYGNGDLWTIIRSANAHLLSDPRNLEVGQKLILPARAD